MSDFGIHYRLARAQDYKFELARAGYNEYDSQALANKTDYPDVRVTRPNTTTDLSKLHTEHLMTVNGFVHPTQYLDGSLYIVGATESMLTTRQNNLGILSFDFGSDDPIMKYELTPDMITADGDIPLYEKALITLEPTVSTAMLVVAGYLVFESTEFFYRVGVNTFALHLNKLAYMERLYELSRYRRIFDELQIPTTGEGNALDGVLARSDATVRRLLTTFNSFMVDLNIPGIEVAPIYLEQTSVPGGFRTQITPKMPLVCGYGKLAEYMVRQPIPGVYTCEVLDAYVSNHLFSEMTTKQIDSYSDRRIPGRTYTLSPGYFLSFKPREEILV